MIFFLFQCLLIKISKKVTAYLPSKFYNALWEFRFQSFVEYTKDFILCMKCWTKVEKRLPRYLIMFWVYSTMTCINGDYRVIIVFLMLDSTILISVFAKAYVFLLLLMIIFLVNISLVVWLILRHKPIRFKNRQGSYIKIKFPHVQLKIVKGRQKVNYSSNESRENGDIIMSRFYNSETHQFPLDILNTAMGHAQQKHNIRFTMLLKGGTGSELLMLKVFGPYARPFLPAFSGGDMDIAIVPYEKSTKTHTKLRILRDTLMECRRACRSSLLDPYMQQIQTILDQSDPNRYEFRQTWNDHMFVQSEVPRTVLQSYGLSWLAPYPTHVLIVTDCIPLELERPGLSLSSVQIHFENTFDPSLSVHFALERLWMVFTILDTTTRCIYKCKMEFIDIVVPM